MKKLLSTFVCVSLILSALVFPVHAVGEELQTEIVNPMYSIEENAVRNEVNLYFEQRELFLTGQAGDPSAINNWNQLDECKHLTAMESRAVMRIGSTIGISSVNIDDIYATVLVSETLIYSTGESLFTENITHSLLLVGESISWQVLDDAYCEQATQFTSCSYVAPSSNIAPTAENDGSALCIIKTAQNEVGYQGGENEYSQYGVWYNSPNAPWCVIFVSWCAHHADIPTSVIPKEAGTGNILEFFEDRDQFLPSASRNGTVSPQAGDIIFFVGDEATTGHVGIVTSVNGNTVSIIDGNWGDKVVSRSVNANSTSIYGYGRPAYSSSGHIGSLWFKNSTHHWKTCENCDADFNKVAHSSATWNTSSTQHWKVCDTCDRKYNIANHSANTWTYTSALHWNTCSSCNIIYNRSAHTSTTWVTTPAKHWKVCSTCNNTFSNASHTFTVDPLTGDQFCTECRYGQGAVINKYENTFVLPE